MNCHSAGSDGLDPRVELECDGRVNISDSSADPNNELPVACTLDAGDGAGRMRRWRALLDATHPIASCDGRTLEVRFEPGAGVLEELVSLAAAEQECCSFVTWAATTDHGTPLLRVLAKPESPDGVASIAALFGV